MVRENEIRIAELAVDLPQTDDAGLIFIGRIITPWTSRLETPRQGRLDGPTCHIEIFDPWIPALDGIERYERLEVLYWLHLSRRDRATAGRSEKRRLGPRAGLHGWHTAARSQAGQNSVHANRATAER